MANIELPKDAEGREIPLNTETLYTDRGPIFCVEKFEYVRSMGWCIYGHYEGETVHFAAIPSSLYLIQPDSWEELEEDLGKIANHQTEVVCPYYDREIKDCEGCKLEGYDCSCSHAFLKDVMARIRKLRGED